MYKPYSGVGARIAPQGVLDKLVKVGRLLAERGYTLRSGGASGSDSAFEQGCDLVGGPKEIFLPSKKFNKNSSPLFYQMEEAFDIAAEIHPAWPQLTPFVRKLMARNVHQVLGRNLNEPSEFVVCWTLHADKVGGTAMAIRVAERYKVPVYNFADAEQKERFYREISA